MQPMFFANKRHNQVDVAITYRNGNNRADIESEIKLLNELSRLMQASSAIHNHTEDSIVRPQITTIDRDSYMGTIDLKFPIKGLVETDDSTMAYSYAGLHAVLVEISNICKRHSDEFEGFRAYINLESMKAPWVLPVSGHGVILREGSHQINYSGDLLPNSAVVGKDMVTVEQVIVVGEPRAVRDFDRTWRYLCKQNAHKTTSVLDVCSMKDNWTNLRWNNVGIFVLVKDAIDNMHWEQVGDMHNTRTEEYIRIMGNNMLTVPLEYGNTSALNPNNIFLSNHAYYEFEAPL